MTAIDPVIEAQIWLQQTLTADNAVTAAFGDRIYAHPAPRDVGYPLLSYQYLTERPDLRLVGTTTLWSTLRFIIQGYIDTNDQMDLDAGSKAVYAALHGKFGATANANILSCVKDRPFYLVETGDSVQYIRLGGEYVIQLRAKD